MERADIKLAIDMLAGMEDDAQIAAHCIGTLEDCGNEIAHLRAKVAELEAKLEKYENLEPVAWVCVNEDGECEQIDYGSESPLPGDDWFIPLYALEK